MLAKAEAAQHLPLHSDLFSHPPPRLKSRRPIWSTPPDHAFSTDARWRAEWHGADVANSSLVADPTSRQPGFDLPRSHWTLLSHFRTGHGHRGVTEHRWGLRASPDCSCGQPQTMLHIVEQCPLTRLEGGLTKLNSADVDATA